MKLIAIILITYILHISKEYIFDNYYKGYQLESIIVIIIIYLLGMYLCYKISKNKSEKMFKEIQQDIKTYDLFNKEIDKSIHETENKTAKAKANNFQLLRELNNIDNSLFYDKKQIKDYNLNKFEDLITYFRNKQNEIGNLIDEAEEITKNVKEKINLLPNYRKPLSAKLTEYKKLATVKGFLLNLISLKW